MAQRERGYLHSTPSAIVIGLLAVVYLFKSGLFGAGISFVGSAHDTSNYTQSVITEAIHSFETAHTVWATLIAFALIAAGAIYTMRVTIRFNLYNKASHLPLIMYIAICVAIASPAQIIVPPLCAMIGLMALSNLFEGYNRNDTAPQIFSGCFYLSSLILLYPSALVLLLLLVAVMVILDRDSREITVVILAAATPLLAKLYVGWLCGVSLDMQCERLFEMLVGGGQRGYLYLYSLSEMLFIVATTIISTVAVVNMEEISIALVSRVRIRFAFTVVLCGLLAAAAPSFETAQMMMVAAPLARTLSLSLFELPKGKSTMLYFFIIAMAILSLFLP